MKTRKFTKVISFILSITLIFSTVALKASAYSTVTTTYDCPKSLCFKDLIISGPYGDPTEKIDSAVPYLGSDTYENVYNNHFSLANKMNEYHLYIVYCPKYDNSDSSLLRHTMTLMFCKHGYTTKSYTQYNSSQHYANKACDHATDIRGSNIYGLTQHLCGENAYLEDTTMEEIAIAYQSQTGCGKETAVLENHTWVYGSWYKNGDNYHSRTKTCSDCGYSTVVSDVHSLTEGNWVNSSSTQHKKTTTCSVCDYSKTTYANHQFTYGDWTDNGNGTCSRTQSCSSCGYNGNETKNHSNTNGQWEYYFTEVDTDYSYQEYHKRDTTCSNCGSKGMDFELHTFTEFSDWSSYTDARHKRSKYCTVCNYTINHTDYHHFLEADYTYEDNDDGTHTVIKPCAECGYTTTEITEHNYVAGEWFKYGTENPYDDEYYHTEYHQRDNVCSDCGNVISEHAEHDWYWETETWVYQSETRHTRTKRCKDCGYGWIYGDYHHFTTDPYYEQYSEDEHTKINPCDECDYENETLEAHSFTASTVYTQFSESQHQVTKSCICGEKHISYADHIDQNSDCYCDKCGYLMTKFSVTVPTTMILTMGTDGKVYSPSDVLIVNNSTAAVSVTKADLSSQNGWNIVPYSTNMANEKVDSKKIGFEMNGIQTNFAGTTDSLSYNNEWIIEKDKSCAVVYDAVVSATSSPIDEQVIEIVFVVDWKE